MQTLAGALVMAAIGLVLAAGALARSGLRQHHHRGWPWWVSAQAVGAAGLLATAFAWPELPSASAAAQVLLLSWPVLMLTGLRRFHARLGLPGRPAIDFGVLALASAVLPWLPGPAVLGVHLWVAAVAWGVRSAEDSAALRLTGAVVALAALPVAASPWVNGASVWPAQALAAAPALWVGALAALASMADRTERELRASRRRLRVLASTDTLTGVANRRHFEEAAQRLQRQQPRLPEAMPVLLLMDIDHFKLVNDRLGHAAGDRALKLVGRCIQEALRDGDLAGRLGGDEFALMLTGATLAQATGVAERIVLQLQQHAPAHRLPALSLSFGMVQLLDDETLDDALHRADGALYEAKRQGRSCAVTAHGDDDGPVFSESQRLGLTAH